MSRLRTLQIEWNSLVPAAQAAGIRGVREVRLYPEGLHERIPHRQARVDWLRRELGMTTAVVPVQAVVENALNVFSFGVEIEFMHTRVNRYAIEAALNAAGIVTQAEQWNHITRNHWKLTTDGSLGSNYAVASELVSPPLLGEDGFRQLDAACRVLKSLGCKVNRKCGLHVHIGVQSESVDFAKALVRLYKNGEQAIDSLLAPSRRGYENTFCQPVRVNEASLDVARSWEDVAVACGQDYVRTELRKAKRYRKLNLMSYFLYKTVEFRQHQGTIETEKTTMWVRFLMRLCMAARNGVSVPAGVSLEALLVAVKCDTKETNWLAARRNFFARNNQLAA